MMEYQIVPLEETHLGQLAALERACFSLPWSENAFRGELKNPLSLWYVALDGERVAGYVGTQTVMDEADVMNLAVHPDYRRQGIGRALMETMQACLAHKGVKTLTLEVRASNSGAISLYQGLGFEQAGLRPNYYLKPREDALILKKRLEKL